MAWRPCANRTPGVQRLVSGREYVMRTDEEEYEEEEVVLVTNAGRTLHSREIREWHAENESTPWCTQEEEVAKKSGVDGIVANISWNKVKYAIWWLGCAGLLRSVDRPAQAADKYLKSRYFDREMRGCNNVKLR